METTRVVISGFGSCSAAGNTDSLWNAALHKKCCLSTYENSELKNSPVKVVGRVGTDLDGLFSRKVNGFASRHARLGAAALNECLLNSGMAEFTDARTGLVFGSASHGQGKVENVMRELKEKPFNKINYNIVNTISNGGACHLLASHYKISGYVHAVEGASCSGMIAIIAGFNLIKSGICDRVFCVVGEANLFPATFLFYARKVRLPEFAVSFFGRTTDQQERSLENFIRPFCVPQVSERGAIAEAGGAVLLESLDAALARKALIHGEVERVGLFFHSENHHGGDTKLTGLKSLVENFKDLLPASLYLPISGCYPLDAPLYTVCGAAYPQTHAFSVEPLIGHTGAATSQLNIILALLSLKNNKLLPTHNLLPAKVDPVCKLLPSDNAAPLGKEKKIMIISSGWGGYNAACTLKTYEN